MFKDIRNLKPYILKKEDGVKSAGFLDKEKKTFTEDMLIKEETDIDMFLDKYKLQVVMMGKLPEGVRVIENV